ncbi:MAG TPA: chlorite dismutase family protein [Gemmatimonadales bacterium]|nr:chlorite dismutase family protein [Gemmatimonadales bacterium]
MPEPTPRTLNHFARVSLGPEYWSLDPGARGRLRAEWLERLRAAADAVHLYQGYGLESDADLLVWSALPAPEPDQPAGFFRRFAAAMAPARRFLSLRETYWGFTLPSQYTRTRSTQEMDPFAGARQPYLVMYPFVKTAEWYLKDRTERQEMMFAHIKVGKQYPDITQLLLYSFGLQDQEFVVVYETADLARFLALVQELRGTEARRYTARDYPLHTGIYQPDAEALAAWL